MDFKRLKIACQDYTDKENESFTGQQVNRFDKTVIRMSIAFAKLAESSGRYNKEGDIKNMVSPSRFLEDWSYDGTQVIGYYDYEASVRHQISFEDAHRLTLVANALEAMHYILDFANQDEQDIEVNLDTLAGHKNYAEMYYMHLQVTMLEGDGASAIMYTLLNYAKSLGLQVSRLETEYLAKYGEQSERNNFLL